MRVQADLGKPLLYCWANERNILISVFIEFCFFSVQNPKFAFLFHLLARRPRYSERSFYPHPFAAHFSLSKCQTWVCECDSSWQFEGATLVVLHLRAELMLVGRGGSNLDGGRSRVRRPSLTAQSFKITVEFLFLTWPAALYFHHILFFSVVFFCGCLFFGKLFQSKLYFSSLF